MRTIMAGLAKFGKERVKELVAFVNSGLMQHDA
jgi:hypothetical protein